MSQFVSLTGTVRSGRRRCGSHIAIHFEELSRILNRTLIHGSVNIQLHDPCLFDPKVATRFDNGRRLLWSASLNGVEGYIYRWSTAPLHIVEFLSEVRLRDECGLVDGQSVQINVNESCISTIAPYRSRLSKLIWVGGVVNYYQSRIYVKLVAPWCELFGLTQASAYQNGTFRFQCWKGGMLSVFYRVIKEVPYIGSLTESRRQRYIVAQETRNFARQKTDLDSDKAVTNKVRVTNLLEYTKVGNVPYSAAIYPTGYHSIELSGEVLKGQRDPAKRLMKLPFDFRDKTVLDIGANQGGMLFALGSVIRWGVGVDYDYRMVNVSTKICEVQDYKNLNFYVFDLEREPLDLLKDFLPAEHVDVVFLLSVCMWIGNWREVIDYVNRISDTLVLETNGTERQQQQQVEKVESLYSDVQLVAPESDDDPDQRRRRMYVCRHV